MSIKGSFLFVSLRPSAIAIVVRVVRKKKTIDAVRTIARIKCARHGVMHTCQCRPAIAMGHARRDRPSDTNAGRSRINAYTATCQTIARCAQFPSALKTNYVSNNGHVIELSIFDGTMAVVRCMNQPSLH